MRAEVRKVLEHIAEVLPRTSFVSISNTLVLFTLSALSSLADPVRIDALKVIDILLATIPDDLVRGIDPSRPISASSAASAGPSTFAPEASTSSTGDHSSPGSRILESLLSLLKIRLSFSASTAIATDLSPEARLKVLGTLERVLRVVGQAERGATRADEPWYLRRAFDSDQAYADYLAGFEGTARRSRRRVRVREDMEGVQVEAFDAAFGAASSLSLAECGLLTPPATPTASTSSLSSAQPTLLSLLHPTLLSSFLDSAPTAFTPTSLASASTGPTHHLGTVSSVLAISRELFTRELASAPSASAADERGAEKAARKMLLALLTHASPYFPFGSSDALSAAAAAGAGAGSKKQQLAGEDRFREMNLAFAELSSLLVLTSAAAGSGGRSAREKGKGKGKRGEKEREKEERVEEVVLERVQEWVVAALRGEVRSHPVCLCRPTSV